MYTIIVHDGLCVTAVDIEGASAGRLEARTDRTSKHTHAIRRAIIQMILLGKYNNISLLEKNDYFDFTAFRLARMLFMKIPRFFLW